MHFTGSERESTKGAQTSQPRATPHGHLVQGRLHGAQVDGVAPSRHAFPAPKAILSEWRCRAGFGMARLAQSTSPHLSHPPPRRSDAIHRHPLPAFTPKLNGCAATPWVSSKREGTPERAEECVPPNSVLWASLPATQGVPPRAGLFQRIWPRHGEVVSQGRDRLQSRRDTGIEIKRVARTIIDGSTSAPRNRVARTRAFPNSA